MCYFTIIVKIACVLGGVRWCRGLSKLSHPKTDGMINPFASMQEIHVRNNPYISVIVRFRIKQVHMDTIVFASLLSTNMTVAFLV